MVRGPHFPCGALTWAQHQLTQTLTAPAPGNCYHTYHSSLQSASWATLLLLLESRV